MTRLPEAVYLVGGRQRRDASQHPEWSRYHRGIVLLLDLGSGRGRVEVEYRPPREARESVERPVLFKAASLKGGVFYTCTSTEVLHWSVPGFDLLGMVSLPEFNDLHHVLPGSNGNLFVVNTGLDMVQEIDHQGEVLRRWNVLGEENPWSRFRPGEDYRRHATTKPHASHPNYVFQADGHLWVTRFEQRDAYCLTDSGRTLPVGGQGPHDGVVEGEKVFFTTVDGRVEVVSLASGKKLASHDLRSMAGTDHALGWCRGLVVVDDRRVLVGFSRLRPTRTKANLAWVARQVGLMENPGVLPTRIALYDLKAGSLLQEWPVESFGLNVLFSIHPVP